MPAAEEICLTAHHEGGFSLWDTEYSNYSVMQSPYGKDVVAQFVASCQKFGVKPCYYFPPSANGYMVTHNYTAEEFVEAQLGQLTELLTNYGSNYVSRLWWDHYEVGGLKCWVPGQPKIGPNPVMCPPGAFPNATGRFIELVRRLSPSTIICPGPDCDAGYRHSGLPAYPTWYPCTMSNSDPEQPLCPTHVESSNATGFHPYTYSTSMAGGWFINGKGDTIGTTTRYWNASRMWHVYFATAGAGQAAVTMNAPPDTTGQIPQRLAENMVTFGKALKAFLTPLVPSSFGAAAAGDGSRSSRSSSGGGGGGGFAATSCENTTLAELDFDRAAVEINAVISREDLSHGQRITSYAIDYLLAADANDTDTDSGAGAGAGRGGSASGTSGASSSWRTFERGNFTDCLQPSETNLSCAVGIGIHGRSVGARVVDFVPVTAAVAKVRFRCITAMGEGDVRLAGFSAHRGAGPEGPTTTQRARAV